mmetsp:Transcript_25284/g.19039  ORF Transcript_25284/g.19039 Transcript_25284/m.19039 type:complete len:195 (+) Transcript_25284:992-1576(+)
MIHNSKAIGVPEVVTAHDIVSANVKLNTIFVSSIFNTKHGLEELNQQEQEAYEKVKLEWDDIEGTMEERAFRFWINSLNIEDLHVNYLYDEASDGLILLKVCHKLDNTCVNWKVVEHHPNNKFKKGINCGEAINACKKLGLKLPGIGGTDILDGNKKNIIAVVWQLVRIHYLKIIGTGSEDEICKWANSMVPDI